MDGRRMDGDVRKYGCMDWWMDGRMDVLMNEWMEG